MPTINQRFVSALCAAVELSAEDQDCLLRMATYLGRSNLWPSSWQGQQRDELRIFFVNEAERYEFSCDELHRLWQQLRRGEAIDWQQLRRLR